MKPVLVHYINVGNIEHADVAEYINRISENLQYDGEYHGIFIPVRGEEYTRVECLNPAIVVSNKREKEKLVNKISRLSYSAEEMVRKMPYMSKNILLTERI